MRKSSLFIAALVLQAGLTATAQAETRQPADVRQPAGARQPGDAKPLVKSANVYDMAFMRVYGQASPPIGYVQFCQRMPEECMGSNRDETRYELTPTRLLELDRINRMINKEIAPATTMSCANPISLRGSGCRSSRISRGPRWRCRRRAIRRRPRGASSRHHRTMSPQYQTPAIQR